MYPGDWRDLGECVNLASTRWINAIIGQTWRGENPFKARKAKQGLWLIHLANLRVMYECQGTLVRRGRGERVLAQCFGWMEACVCFFFFEMLFGRLLVLPSSSFFPFCRLSGRNKWSLDGETTKRCTERAEWEGSGIALQMRWGNVVRGRPGGGAAARAPACFAKREYSIRPLSPPRLSLAVK